MGEHGRVHVGLESRPAAPAAQAETEAAFQVGDTRFDTGAEALELPVHPRRGGHVGLFHAAFLVEHRMRHAERLGLLEVLARRVAAVKGRVRRRRAVVFDMPLKHRQAARAVGRIALLHHRVEHQSAAPGGEVDLVTEVRAATALEDNVGVRLEQAQYLFRRRYRLAVEHAALRLIHDTEQQLSGFADVLCP